MTPAEVQGKVSQPWTREPWGCGFPIWKDENGNDWTQRHVCLMEEYAIGPDWLGNSQRLIVHFRPAEKPQIRVTDWEVWPAPRTRPPWLDKTLKAVGW
jgi:hypothetical protein